MTLEEIIDGAIEANERASRYAVLNLSVRRRVQNALDLLEQGNVDAAKEMLKQALADDGGLLQRRVDSIMKEWRKKYAGSDNA
jgi:hypothetical protein